MPPALTKKIAGVPTWGWLAAAVFAIGIGIYIRHKSSLTSSSSSSGPTGADDLANSLAGGATSPAASGLDPALAELLANAQSALVGQGQAASDAMMGGPYGYSDPGTFYDQSSGFETPMSTSISGTSTGTSYDQNAWITASVPTWAPHETPYNPATGLVSDPWSGSSWTPGFATLTAADVARATGGGAAPLSAAAQRPRVAPKPKPPVRVAGVSSASKKRKAPAKAAGGWVRVK